MYLFMFVQLQTIGGRVINGIVGNVGVGDNLPIISAQLLDAISSEKFTEMDGLCSFEVGSYKLRNGVTRSDATGFVDSWK